MKLSLKELILSHVNYRDVFNAPVSKDSLRLWVGMNDNLEQISVFELSISELIEESLIVEKEGFIAVASKEHILLNQKKKFELANKILSRSERFLYFFGKLPFIRYVGISGSVAANNPTVDKDQHVDLDLFVICSDNTLWIFFLFERALTNLIRVLKGNHFYCFNYVTEESFLEVYNKNFYTATEVFNLKTVMDKGVYDIFINKNEWCQIFYPNILILESSERKVIVPFLLKLLKPLNYVFFIVFCLLRGIKKGSLSMAFEFVSKFDPKQKCNLKRISNPNGGYQEKICERFNKLFRSNFPNYYSEKIIKILFPDESLFAFSADKNIHDFEINELFNKYASVTYEEDSV